MRAVRAVSIPIDHLIAEVAAFPLVSEASFELGLHALDPRMRDPKTQRLWRAAEGLLLAAFPAFSVEEVVAVRDRSWFSLGSDSTLPLDRYLRELAGMFLVARGGVLRPTLSGEHVVGADRALATDIRARQAWRWLTFAMPSDLLAAASNLDQTAPWRVDMIPAVLARCLEMHGYAESHLHFGAAFEFSSFWVATMRALASRETRRNVLTSPGAVLEGGRLLLPWLLRAAVGRYCLAAFLRDHGRAGGYASMGEWLERHLIPIAAETLGESRAARLLLCLDELVRAGLPSEDDGDAAGASRDDALTQALYRDVTWISHRVAPTRFTAVHDDDPIAPFVPRDGEASAPPEIAFMRSALSYQRESPGDHGFARLLWQIVRIRNLLYRHVTQRPLTPGLQWFVRTYGRLSRLRRPFTSGMLLEGALQLCTRGSGLVSLEARTTPEERCDGNLRLAQAAARVGMDAVSAVAHDRSETNTRRLEIGLVLHLTKSRGEATMRGLPAAHWVDSEADPSIEGQCFRYERYYLKKRCETLALAGVLLHFPGTLHVLRGIDVCTDELGVPTWVLVPLIRYLRDVGNEAARHLTIDSPVTRPLGVTVHAGEDFVHLLGGLRRVDEAVHWFSLRDGDRIGHAVALGVDARVWATSAGRLPIPREERLLDLVWEWRWYARGYQQSASDRLALIERETLRITREMFLRPYSPAEMDRMIEALHSERCLRSVGFPTGLPVRPLTPECEHLAILASYLASGDVFSRGRVIEWVDPATEAETLASIQRGLRQEIGMRGLTIEVNPSSNLLVANLADLATHPLWRLRPPRGDGDAPPVSICIGSDDPVTFATNLREEFALLYDALLAGGLSDDQAERWLNDVRQRGLDARFTLSPHDTCGAKCFRPVIGLGANIQPVL